METVAIVATLIKAAVDAIIAAVQAGQSHELVLQKIRHIADDSAAVDKDVDAVASGG